VKFAQPVIKLMLLVTTALFQLHQLQLQWLLGVNHVPPVKFITLHLTNVKYAQPVIKPIQLPLAANKHMLQHQFSIINQHNMFNKHQFRQLLNQHVLFVRLNQEKSFNILHQKLEP
jgi:hypothetical protein